MSRLSKYTEHKVWKELYSILTPRLSLYFKEVFIDWYIKDRMVACERRLVK